MRRMSILLTRHLEQGSPRWAADGKLLRIGTRLAELLRRPAHGLAAAVTSLTTDDPPGGELLPPIEDVQEVWASGVTYLRSRQAREAESNTADVYERVYAAPRPELFFKALGFRVVGHGQPIAVRSDSTWSVPEPELALVINAVGEIVGYTAGNDVSCRDIEGDNPLYLPQAKVFDGSCALGPGIVLVDPETMTDLPIQLWIQRGAALLFSGETRTSQLKRGLQELVRYLTFQLGFPHGVFLLTGTGIVPGDGLSLQGGDRVRIRVGELELENPVQ